MTPKEPTSDTVTDKPRLEFVKFNFEFGNLKEKILNLRIQNFHDSKYLRLAGYEQLGLINRLLAQAGIGKVDRFDEKILTFTESVKRKQMEKIRDWNLAEIMGEKSVGGSDGEFFGYEPMEIKGFQVQL
jgi:hypothetical protein